MEEHINKYIKTHSEEYYRIIEDSNTAILCIHCLFGSPRYFNDYIDLVPEDWSIYNILLKGHGGTVEEYGEAGMRDWKKQVEGTYEELAGKYDHIYLLSHSLGTLFSITLANAHPDKIKGMFLLSAPTKPIMTPRMLLTAVRLLTRTTPEDDMVGLMAKEKYSVEVSANLFRYRKFPKNFVTLFQEIFAVRKHIGEITVPCWVVFSRHDELVLPSAVKYFENVKSAKVMMLEHSYHFYYTEEDYTYLKEQFAAFCALEGKSEVNI